MVWDSFPTELPVSKLSLLLDIWRGNPVDSTEAALAACNVVGYAIGRGLVKPVAVFGAGPDVVAAAPTPPTATDVEAAFGEVLSRPMAAGPAAASGAGSLHGQSVAAPTMAMVAFDDTKKIPWQTILSVAIPILRKLILGF